jgi:hypothetical protein
MARMLETYIYLLPPMALPPLRLIKPDYRYIHEEIFLVVGI